MLFIDSLILLIELVIVYDPLFTILLSEVIINYKYTFSNQSFPRSIKERNR